MYSTFIILLLCFSATLASLSDIDPFNILPLKRFNRAAVFGDSTSDIGNVYELTDHTWPIVPPYYKGQYCDNANWFDRLDIVFKQNYAYGSATTDNNFVQGLAKLNTVPVPDIRQQVAEYLNKPKLPSALARIMFT